MAKVSKVTTRMLGFGFLTPAMVAVVIFFLLPVLLTVVFAFTNMSTSTGISGGDYQLVEDRLQLLVVVDHVVLGLGVEVHLGHVHDAGVARIEDLAVHRAGGHLREGGERAGR